MYKHLYYTVMLFKKKMSEGFTLDELCNGQYSCLNEEDLNTIKNALNTHGYIQAHRTDKGIIHNCSECGGITHSRAKICSNCLCTLDADGD